MTYTYTLEGIFESVPETKKLAVVRPAGTFSKAEWIKFASDFCDRVNAPDPGDDVKSPSMKLVDILARELKVWPEGSLAATQDGDGEINQQSESGRPEFCERLDQWKAGPGRLCIFSHEKLILAEDYTTAIVTRAEWQAAVVALKVAEGIADAEAGNLSSLDEVKGKWEIRRNPLTLSAMIDIGWIVDPFKYDISCNWPRQRYCIDPVPGLQYRKQSADQAQEAAADHKECLEFLKSRIEHLNAYIELLKTNNQNLFDAGQTSSKQLADLSAKFADLKVELEERKEEAKQTIEFVVTPSALRALQIGIPVLRIRDDRKMIVRVGS